MLIIDNTSVKISFESTGAVPAVHSGKEFALLHCTKNANLQAGEAVPAAEVASGNAFNVKASVFLTATENESDIGNLEFGIAQVSFAHAYEFLYVGRLESDGSTAINMRTGFSKNPSLDARLNKGQTIDEKIFTPDALTVNKVSGPKQGLLVTVIVGDHPNNAIPLIFENRNAKSSNFLANASRVEEFIAYFLFRSKGAPAVTILGRIGWSISWNSEFNWSAQSARPQKNVKAALLMVGQAKLGAPEEGDAFAAVALSRATPTTPDQDIAAADAAWIRRLDPICVQKKDRPPNFRANFFK